MFLQSKSSNLTNKFQLSSKVKNDPRHENIKHYHPTSRTENAIIKLVNASWRNIYLGGKTKEKPANLATR